MGLINPVYGFGGLDGAVHLGEDCFEPAKTVPGAIINSLVVGVITTFFFAVSMLYCMKDLDAAVNSRTGVPIYEVWFQATQSSVAATIFMAMMLLALFITSIGSVQSGSRLTWSFARDDAIILSQYIKITSDKFGVPGLSLLFNAFWLALLGYMDNDMRLRSSAFNVSIGTAILTELISFSFPAALMMWQGRNQKFLPANSPFNLGRFGWLVNSLVVAWTAFALIVFSFPVTLPVSAGSM
ncbi:MAG: hypothetical protein Q9209_005006, partial [Squamulea sp. 1 TL-2023]